MNFITQLWVCLEGDPSPAEHIPVPMAWFAAIADKIMPSRGRDLEPWSSSAWSFELCGLSLLPTQMLCCHMDTWHRGLSSPFISYPLWEVLW